MEPPMKGGNRVLSACGTTIFEVMSRLARQHDAINLGQGFPDEDGPRELREHAANAILAGPNQYPPSLGLLDLREAIASHALAHYDLTFDPASNVMVTSGATEALACCLLGLLNPGDEVVCFEPTYDSYRPIVELAGASVRLVRLSPPSWTICEKSFAAAFTPQTKLVLLNSPMNPTGKVFSPAELDLIAAQVAAHDAYAVCDEVYEHIAFGVPHVPLMTRPGMGERTVRIGSAGKTFSLTGWKVGYVMGAAEMMMPIARAHQFLNFTTPPGLQAAVGKGLGLATSYYEELAADLAAKRDLLRDGLSALGFGVADSDGTYFLGADYSPLGIEGDDTQVAEQLVVQAGVATIPYSAFYEAGQGPRTWLRFAFCKKKAVLEEALGRLGEYVGRVR